MQGDDPFMDHKNLIWKYCKNRDLYWNN